MVDRHSSSSGFHRLGAAVAAVSLLALSSTALAAANWRVSCDRVARDLQSNEITAELLTVAIVDHMTEDHGATAPVGQNAEDPSAPLLFLTPRVAHILQDVFGDTEAHAVSAVERVRRIMLAADAATRVESPPESAGGGGDAVNDSLPDFESVILSGPMTETFYDNENLPSFQRQMYRTDI